MIRTNVNINKLKGRTVQEGMTTSRLADQAGMSRATLYRKFKEPDLFTYREITAIASALQLNRSDITDIFFRRHLAQQETQ